MPTLYYSHPSYSHSQSTRSRKEDYKLRRWSNNRLILLIIISIYTSSSRADEPLSPVLDIAALAKKTFSGKDTRYQEGICDLKIGATKRDFAGRFYLDLDIQLKSKGIVIAHYSRRPRQRIRLRAPDFYREKEKYLEYDIGFSQLTIELLMGGPQYKELKEFHVNESSNPSQPKIEKIHCTDLAQAQDSGTKSSPTQ